MRKLHACAGSLWRDTKGATMVEYLIVTGFCALVAIVTFHRFGRQLHTHLEQQAEHVHGQGMPNAGDLLDSLIDPPNMPGGCAISLPLTCDPSIGGLPDDPGALPGSGTPGGSPVDGTDEGLETPGGGPGAPPGSPGTEPDGGAAPPDGGAAPPDGGAAPPSGGGDPPGAGSDPPGEGSDSPDTTSDETDETDETDEEAEPIPTDK